MKLEQAEVSRIEEAEAMRAFIAKLSPARQAKVSVVCGAIIEQGEPTGGLNLRFRNERILALALSMKAGR